jgi:hypothetical protein
MFLWVTLCLEACCFPIPVLRLESFFLLSPLFFYRQLYVSFMVRFGGRFLTIPHSQSFQTGPFLGESPTPPPPRLKSKNWFFCAFSCFMISLLSVPGGCRRNVVCGDIFNLFQKNPRIFFFPALCAENI